MTEERLLELEKHLNLQSGRLDSLEGRFSAIELQVDDINKKVGGIEKAMSRATADLKEQQGILMQAGSVLETLPETISKVVSQVQALSKQVTSVIEHNALSVFLEKLRRSPQDLDKLIAELPDDELRKTVRERFGKSSDSKGESNG